MAETKVAFKSELWIYLTVLLCMLVITTAHSQSLLFTSSGITELKRNQQWSPAGQNSQLDINQSIRTLQGSATIKLDFGTLKLDQNTEIEYSSEGFRLIAGRAYLDGRARFVSDYTRLFAQGKSRFDVLEGIFRAANIEGSIDYLDRTNAFKRLGSGQQITSEADKLSFGVFFEHDPWYQKRATINVKEASVLDFQGRADYWVNGAWQSISIGQVIAGGDRIQTHESTWLELKTDDNLIRLQSNTELELVELESALVGPDDTASLEETTALNLIKGSIWLVVESENQNFQISTPGLIAGTRGTTFRVIADESNPSIKTFNGRVFGCCEPVFRYL